MSCWRFLSWVLLRCYLNIFLACSPGLVSEGADCVCPELLCRINPHTKHLECLDSLSQPFLSSSQVVAWLGFPSEESQLTIRSWELITTVEKTRPLQKTLSPSSLRLRREIADDRSISLGKKLMGRRKHAWIAAGGYNFNCSKFVVASSVLMLLNLVRSLISVLVVRFYVSYMAMIKLVMSTVNWTRRISFLPLRYHAPVLCTAAITTHLLVRNICHCQWIQHGSLVAWIPYGVTGVCLGFGSSRLRFRFVRWGDCLFVLLFVVVARCVSPRQPVVGRLSPFCGSPKGIPRI